MDKEIIYNNCAIDSIWQVLFAYDDNFCLKHKTPYQKI